MAVEAMPLFDVDVARQMWYNKKCSNTTGFSIDPQQKYAIGLFKFDAATQRTDYPSMATTITGHALIDEVELVSDGITPTVIEGRELILFVSSHLRIHDIPEEPE